MYNITCCYAHVVTWPRCAVVGRFPHILPSTIQHLNKETKQSLLRNAMAIHLTSQTISELCRICPFRPPTLSPVAPFANFLSISDPSTLIDRFIYNYSGSCRLYIWCFFAIAMGQEPIYTIGSVRQLCNLAFSSASPNARESSYLVFSNYCRKTKQD